MRAGRPTIELLGGFRTVPGTEALVVALGRTCHVRASDPALSAPDARLALSTDAHRLDAAVRSRVRDGTPVAVVVGRDEDDGELASHVDAVVRIGTVETGARADAANTVVVPHPAIDTSGHPAVGPLVRARWRRHLGLPEDLVVIAGFPHATPLQAASLPAALAVCATAAVRGPHVLLALALGTPVVTDAATAARLGARDGEEVVTAHTATDVREVARALARETRTAARLGTAGRRLAEGVHDTGFAARELLSRLSLLAAGDGTRPHLDDRLAELGTAPGSPVALRARERAVPFVALAGTAAR